MGVLSTDSRELLIVVDSILDVTGPTNVSPAAYAVGWRASVRSAGPDAQRTFVVVQSASGAHVWQEQVTSVPAPKPSARFVVGKAPLDLTAPGSATYLTLASALLAVQAYQASTGGLPASILLHPDTYAESVVLPPNVSIEGLGPSPLSVFVNGGITLTGADGSVSAVGSLRCSTLNINYAGDQRCEVNSVQVDSSTTVAQTPGSGSGIFKSWNATLLGSVSISGDNLSIEMNGGLSTAVIVDGTAGTVGLRAYGVRMIAGGAGGVPFVARRCRSDLIECVWDNRDDLSPIAEASSSSVLSIVGGWRARPSLPYAVVTNDGTGQLYWQNVAGPSAFLDVDVGFDPNLGVRSPLVTGSGFIGSTVSINVDGSSVPIAVVPRSMDTVQVAPSYAVPVSNVRANNAYALLQLPNANEMIDRKRLMISNVSYPLAGDSGPVAVIPEPGQTIAFLSGSSAKITSLDYLILGPGASVELSNTSKGGWIVVS